MAEKILIQGNEAVGWGALAADCSGFFGYPITPQNEVIEWFAREFPKRGKVFLQSASETGSINMLHGGAVTGVRSMTSTSSPGWALMQEGMSNLSNAELPCVIVLVQRGWNTTRHAQTDYTSVTQGGGYGGYKTIVLAPKSAQEIYDFMQLGFYLADKHRTPVIVLSDAILGQMMESIELKKLYFEPLPEKDWAVTGKANSRDGNRRYSSIAQGMLPTPKHPNLKTFWEDYANKIKKIKEEEVRFETYQIEDAEVILVAFGYVARVSLDAMQRAREKGLKVGLLRPITLWPFPSAIVKEIADKNVKFLVVEDNMGQMIEDVKLSVEGRADVFLVSSLDRHLPIEEGAIYPEKVLEKIEEII
ncbi:MAG: 3-methyl-2-oxobutanoate dehydrogenase subunit VorB [Spirochaetota bacterium]|nr:3-methyl-2-oxobutanoate dehydrogenase subunit VorB [Spirochaetota bacterium]